MFGEIYGSGFFFISSFNGGRKYNFSGYMCLNESIVIGERGLNKYLEDFEDLNLYEEIEGRFSIVHESDDKVIARTDAFGQDAIYYYFNNGVWALSNSFLLLCRNLYEEGIDVSLDYDQAQSLKVKHGFTQQLISNDTLIHQVKLLPMDKIMVIDKKERRLKFDKLPGYTFEEYSYCEKIEHYVGRAACINRSLLKYFKGRVTVDITGGVDSRLVLATILASGVDLSDVNFLCAKDAGDDYRVASLLAEKYGFEIKNKSFVYGQGSQEVLFDFWKLGNLGVYNPVYFPSSTRPQRLIHFHGASGECFRDFYGTDAFSYLSKVAKGQNDQDGVLALNRKFGKFLSCTDGPVESSEVMFSHYLHFRSRFHFGRSTFRNLGEYFVSPLSSLALLSAFRMLSLKEKENRSLLLDVFLMCGHDILDIPFDEESKCFSFEDIQSSRCYSYGKRVFCDREFVVYYEEEPRQPKTEKIKEMKEYMIEDLKRLKNTLVDFGYCTGEEVDQAVLDLNKADRVTLLGQSAAKLISVGEVLNLCGS